MSSTVSGGMVTTLDLTMDPSAYCPNWGWWEGLREFMQNSEDAHRRGAEYEASFTPTGNGLGTVRLLNRGANMTRSALLMGGTDKRGDSSQVGYHGDGLKTGTAVLLRLGGRVTVRTQAESWAFQEAWSPVYDAKVLRVEIGPGLGELAVEALIENVPGTEWVQAQTRFINCPTEATWLPPTPGARTSLYVGGIWVSDLPGEASTLGGLSLPIKAVQLDRDRNLVTQKLAPFWARAVDSAIQSGTMAADGFVRWMMTGRLDATDEECRAVAQPPSFHGDLELLAFDICRTGGADRAAMTQAWVTVMGDITVTCSTAEARHAQHLQLPFVMSMQGRPSWVPALEPVIRARLASLIPADGVLPDSALTPPQLECLTWLRKLVGATVWVDDPLTLVAADQPARGSVCGKEIRISLTTLDESKGDCLAVLAHELAHWSTDAADLTREHTRAMESWMARLVNTAVATWRVMK